ncbi:MAG: glycoside hydrolase family 16 protein [Flavobacteriales bacterium]|nr:glycoside hydrolase family 16 protein [Flavobacteriales bacterium]
MRSLLFIFILACGSLSSQTGEHLIWHDEFRHDSLDVTKWVYDIGNGANGWGNNELQYYTNNGQNVKVEDGLLKIIGKQQAFGGFNYTSGKIKTKGKFAFNSGRIEIKAKFPSGQGLWPAVWMLPEDNFYGTWPVGGEIDIIEILGHETNKVHGTLHYGRYWPNNQMTGSSFTIGAPDFASDFHIFEMEWTENSIKWSVDGTMYNEIAINDISNDLWPFDQDFHLIMNLAIGGNWPGSPNGSTPWPAEMHVEYVRLFQNTDDVYISGRDHVHKDATNVSYKVLDIPGASYFWIVPSGASITSGQGTNEILVDWTNAGGTIEVEIDKCCSMYPISLTVNVLESECSSNIYDANGNKLLHWTQMDGSLNELILNPSANAVNSSSHTAFYARNAGAQYDVLRFVTDIIGDASVFENGTIKFEMDVHTSAPIGTEILIQLEDHELAQNSFPAGRHSVYQTFTSVQNQWHTLTFDYSWSPDGNVSDHKINDLLFLFAPNTFTGHSFYIDNIRISDPSCQ